MTLSRIGISTLLAIGIWSGARADQLVMKNGDRIAGTIIRKDDKNIIIKSDNFGVITAAWDQVDSIKAEAPLTIVFANGSTTQATLASSEGKIEVVQKDSRTTVLPAEIAIIRNADEQRAYERMLHPGWFNVWAGTATVGLAGTTGNAKTRTFTVGMNAARATNTDKTTLYFSAIAASAFVNNETSATARAVRGGWGYNHNVSSRLFINTFNDYEYDRFQNLDLRFVIGGGVGYNLVKGERSRLDVLGGIAYNRESFATPLIRNSAEAYWGNEFSYKLSGATSFFQSFRMFNNLTNTGTYRINADVGATTKVTKWLNWNVSLSDRYLSDPAPGRKGNDFLYTTGLGIIFAR